MRKTAPRIDVEVKHVKLVALGVEYTPGQPKTLIYPGTLDGVRWVALCVVGDDDVQDITPLLKNVVLDDIEEKLCEHFREK